MSGWRRKRCQNNSGENRMNFKILFVTIILCFYSLVITAQDKRKIFVCDKPITEQDYKKWLERDAAYIITKQEQEAYLKLQTNEDRQKFIDKFWARRDPNPDTKENEFRDEYYARVAYANENFASGIPGWKTDRGFIYILCGKPDKIDKGHKDFEGLKYILFETWSYKRYSKGSSNIEFTFIDPIKSGEFFLAQGKRNEILNKTASDLTICFMCPQDSL